MPEILIRLAFFAAFGVLAIVASAIAVCGFRWWMWRDYVDD